MRDLKLPEDCFLSCLIPFASYGKFHYQHFDLILMI